MLFLFCWGSMNFRDKSLSDGPPLDSKGEKQLCETGALEGLVICNTQLVVDKELSVLKVKATTNLSPIFLPRGSFNLRGKVLSPVDKPGLIFNST